MALRHRGIMKVYAIDFYSGYKFEFEVVNNSDRNVKIVFSAHTFNSYSDYDGSYLIGVCSGRMTNEVSLSYRNIYRLAKAIGFEPRILYNLDGGGSSAFVYKGERLNKLTQGEDRPCPNYLIIGK